MRTNDAKWVVRRVACIVVWVLVGGLKMFTCCWFRARARDAMDAHPGSWTGKFGSIPFGLLPFRGVLVVTVTVQIYSALPRSCCAG
jgi:hypothetical protein